MPNKIRVDPVDLKLGMYIVELDRPWLDSPFLFQGFTLSKDEDINELRSLCKYVYVDMALSDAGLPISPPSTSPDCVSEKSSQKLQKAPNFSEIEFRKSLTGAYYIYKDARRWVDTMLEDARLGESIDTEKARALVVALADQVITNPDALVWLTHLRNRDEYTATHCINVCILALSFGRDLGLNEQQLHQLGMGALLHDIGKMRVPDEVLNKPGVLTVAELEIMKGHPAHGHAMLVGDHKLDKESLHIVLHHHERLDGKGYPGGLVEMDIPLLTRIASIVDVYDAITSDRCYHDGVAPALALENLFRWSTGNYDVSLLEEFIKCLGIYPIGSVVRLNTDAVGVVVATDEGHRVKPIVLLAIDANGKDYLPRRLVNLGSGVWEKSGQMLSIVEVLAPGSLGIELTTIVQEELSYSEHEILKLG